MMPSPDDDMSLREIARTQSDFRQEFRNQIGQLLRADVYRAEQAALEARISGLEKDRDTAETNTAATRRLALGAMLSAIATIVVSLILVNIR